MTRSVDQVARDWLSRTWAATVDHVRRGRPAVTAYAFGKHPAFADFLDVGRLPPVPAAFRHFHDHLRPALERDGGPAVPVLIAWQDHGESAVLHVHPSRDRGDPVTGAFRRCPLFVGLTDRTPLADLLHFAGGRLSAVASTADGDQLLADLSRPPTDWPAVSPDELVTLAIATWAGHDGVVFVDGGGAIVTPGELSSVTPEVVGGWLANRDAPPR